jgi:Mn-dependent DtxR family transcriptional regulator
MPKKWQEIIQAISGNNDIQTVPQLAELLDEPVSLSLMEALFKLRKEGYISWKPSKYLYLTSKGYQACEVVNAS